MIEQTTLSELPPVPEGMLEGPAAWRAQDMQKDLSWQYILSDTEIQ